MSLLAQVSTLFRNNHRSFRLLKHFAITAFYKDSLSNGQFHHFGVLLKLCRYPKFYIMEEMPASAKKTLDNAKCNQQYSTSRQHESLSREAIDPNTENVEGNSNRYFKCTDNICTSNNKFSASSLDDTDNESSTSFPMTDTKIIDEAGELPENVMSATNALPLSDIVPKIEVENKSGQFAGNVTEADNITPLDSNKNHHAVKNMNHANRKRKSNLNLHATFKRPRLTSDDELSQTTHYFENGLRKAVPYDFKYNTFCKGRWVGKTLAELYTTEFRLYPIQYYERAVKDQRVFVNLKPVKSLSRVVKNNDLITSMSHRHECPISAAPITIVADTDDFFVINKPCSIPLHPAGRFRHNCLLSILARDFDKRDIFSIHRLDRMTSGLTVFTKSSERANKCHTQIKERMVQKEYVCRVVGDFTKFSLPENHDHRVEIHGDEVTVSESLKVYDMKMGTSIVSRHDDAKDCQTSFRCLSTNGKTSVVRCKPKTGRTHQIRVHLQYLGFPITNDPMYNTCAWGEDRFKLGPISKPMQDVMEELTMLKKWVSILESFDNSIQSEANRDNCKEVDAALKPEPTLSPAMLEAAAKVDGIVPYRADCEECKNPLPDPKPNELVMYLHALRYKGPDWEFETPLPEWAAPDWVGDGQ